MDTSTSVISEPSVEDENNTRWGRFLFIWTVIVAIGGFILFVPYKYFPGYMLMCLTKEFLISGSFIRVVRDSRECSAEIYCSE